MINLSIHTANQEIEVKGDILEKCDTAMLTIKGSREDITIFLSDEAIINQLIAELAIAKIKLQEMRGNK